MTSQNARLNQQQTVNDQLKFMAMKIAIESRRDDESWADVLSHAKDIFEFVKVNGPGSLSIVPANSLPEGAA